MVREQLLYSFIKLGFKLYLEMADDVETTKKNNVISFCCLLIMKNVIYVAVKRYSNLYILGKNKIYLSEQI